METPAPNTTICEASGLCPASLPSHNFSQGFIYPRAQKGKSRCLRLEVLWGRERSLRKLHRYPDPGFACFLHIQTPTESKEYAVSKQNV